jgi:hypothetical protein
MRRACTDGAARATRSWSTTTSDWLDGTVVDAGVDDATAGWAAVHATASAIADIAPATSRGVATPVMDAGLIR